MKFDNKRYIAEKIKYHRKRMKLTQAELAEIVDLSVQHISRIESGCFVPSLKSFFLLVKSLNMDLREFGYGQVSTGNLEKDRLIERIINATDSELVFYRNLINAVSESIV
ncbi:MAG: helix-turn-helix domain-containing protein, partial [Candidatus Gastranaerophilales bacterium]|nr:helix-turn-helix domain-containing protein [Candidatus Gastranaerophilales bacterium]